MDTSLLSNGSTIVPPDVAIREVSPIQDYSAMNNSLLKRTLSLQFPRSSFMLGPSSVFDINLLNSIIKSMSIKWQMEMRAQPPQETTIVTTKLSKLV